MSTKAVDRWECGEYDGAHVRHPEGPFVRFTDHEATISELRSNHDRVVGELKDHIRLSAISALELDAQNRKELAASRAEVEGLRADMQEILRVHANGTRVFYIAAKALEK